MNFNLVRELVVAEDVGIHTSVILILDVKHDDWALDDVLTFANCKWINLLNIC